jgi:hypothetical protein
VKPIARDPWRSRRRGCGRAERPGSCAHRATSRGRSSRPSRVPAPPGWSAADPRRARLAVRSGSAPSDRPRPRAAGRRRTRRTDPGEVPIRRAAARGSRRKTTGRTTERTVPTRRSRVPARSPKHAARRERGSPGRETERQERLAGSEQPALPTVRSRREERGWSRRRVRPARAAAPRRGRSPRWRRGRPTAPSHRSRRAKSPRRSGRCPRRAFGAPVTDPVRARPSVQARRGRRSGTNRLGPIGRPGRRSGRGQRRKAPRARAALGRDRTGARRSEPVRTSSRRATSRRRRRPGRGETARRRRRTLLEGAGGAPAARGGRRSPAADRASGAGGPGMPPTGRGRASSPARAGSRDGSRAVARRPAGRGRPAAGGTRARGGWRGLRAGKAGRNDPAVRAGNRALPVGGRATSEGPRGGIGRRAHRAAPTRQARPRPAGTRR